MNTCTTSHAQPTGTLFHPGFMHYVSIDDTGVRAFLKAIAVNAVGQAITLAALGIKPKAMTMPNMSIEPRCRLVLPKGAWVDNLKCMQNAKTRQVRYLEVICWQISGTVAEFAFDEFDYYGNLGLGDIEDSYRFLAAYESVHNVPQARVLAGCTVVVEHLLAQHYEVAEPMVEHLSTQGNLCQREVCRYLSGVQKEALGKQVLLAFQEPWIEDEAERVHRMFVGS
jgi:hypothetical protein